MRNSQSPEVELIPPGSLHAIPWLVFEQQRYMAYDKKLSLHTHADDTRRVTITTAAGLGATHDERLGKI